MPKGGDRPAPRADVDDVRRAARGDEDAWARLVAEWAPRVFALLHSRCRDAELAEEITQSAFVTVSEKLASYSEEGKFGPWVFQIAVNRWRDEGRRRQRQRTTAAGDSLERLSVDGGETSGAGAADYRTKDPHASAALERAMEQLSEADRLAVDLRHVGGLTFRQMAEALGEPIGTLLARHHRALAKLRELIEKDLGRPPE